MTNEPLLDPALLAAWTNQDNAIVAPSSADLHRALDHSHRTQVRQLQRLTVQEALPSAAVAAVFAGFGLLADQRQWAFFAAAVISLAVGLFLVGFTLNQRVVADGFGDSVRSQLERSLVQAGNLAWLYRTVPFWYLTPSALAVALVGYGLAATGIALVVFAAGYAAVLFALHRANRQVARRYQQEYDRLDGLRRDLDETL